jgi:hypothetical protein
MKSKMKTMAITFGSLLLICSCSGQPQQQKDKHSGLKPGIVVNDSANRPRMNVKVNKHYDSKGNLVKYDSSYTYTYSGKSQNLQPLANDSIFRDFHSYFKGNMDALFDRHNDALFFNDSLFEYDFFNHDFFQERFRLNQPLYNRFLWQMDSIKADFLEKKYPRKSKTL